MDELFLSKKVKKPMRDYLLCVSAFSVSMTLSSSTLFEHTDPEVSRDKYLLMDCDSLYDKGFKIEIDGKEYRSIGECSFRNLCDQVPLPQLTNTKSDCDKRHIEDWKPDF